MVFRTMGLLVTSIMGFLLWGCDSGNESADAQEMVETDDTGTETEDDKVPVEKDSDALTDDETDTRTEATDTSDDSTDDSTNVINIDDDDDINPLCESLKQCDKTGDSAVPYVCPDGAEDGQVCVEAFRCGEGKPVLCMNQEQACQVNCPKMGCWFWDTVTVPREMSCEVE